MRRKLSRLLWSFFLTLSAFSAEAQWVHTGYPDSIGWVSCLAAHEGIIFAGTWGRGVYRSTDGGDTWEQINNGLSSVWVHDLAVVAHSIGGGNSNLLAGVRGGVCRSIDDGLHWSEVNSGLPAAIEVLAFGVAGTTILAGAAQQGTISGVYRSVDNGATWTNCTFGFTNLSDSSVYTFASTISGGQTYFYAGTGQGVFLSSSDGTSWSPIRNGLPSAPIFSLAINPGSVDPLDFTVLAGVSQDGIYFSSNNGLTWSHANHGLPGHGAVYTDIEVNAARARVYAADGYVSVSSNGGEDWLDTGWPYVEGGPAECLLISGDYLYAGVNHGNGGIWKYCVAADTDWVVQPSGTTEALYTVKAIDNNVVWCGGTNGTVLRTTNGGTGWLSVGGGILASDIVSAIEPLDANTALVATASTTGTRVFKTANSGATWSVVFNQPGGMIGGIQMKTSVEGYAVGYPVGGKWTVLKTTDGGSSWARIATEPSQVAGEEGSLSVQLLGNTIWFGSTSGSVYRSTNLGASWTSVATSGPDVSSLHFNSASLGLAGSNTGSTRLTTDAGVTWRTANAAGYNGLASIAGIGNEFWAVTGKAIAYTNTSGQFWKFSSPGHADLVQLNAVNFSPIALPVNGWAVGDSGGILHYRRQPTGVANDAAPLPTMCTLGQNYPNPSNPSTTIRFTIPYSQFTTLKVFDALGREVAALVNENLGAGSYEVKFEASGLASGVYIYRLQAGNYYSSRKLVLLK